MRRALLLVATAAVILLTAEQVNCRAVHALPKSSKSILFNQDTATLNIVQDRGGKAGAKPFVDRKFVEGLKDLYNELTGNTAQSFHFVQAPENSHDVEVVLVSDPAEDKPEDVDRMEQSGGNDDARSTKAAQTVGDGTHTDVLMSETPKGRCILCGGGDCPACYKPDANGVCRAIYGCKP